MKSSCQRSFITWVVYVASIGFLEFDDVLRTNRTHSGDQLLFFEPGGSALNSFVSEIAEYKSEYCDADPPRNVPIVAQCQSTS